MKERIRKFLIVLCLCLLFALTACFPGGQTDNTTISNPGSDNSAVIPAQITEDLLNDLSIDAKIIAPENAGWGKYEVSLRSFTEDDLNVSYLNGKMIDSQHQYNSEYGSQYYSASYELFDGTVLFVDAGAVSYIHPQYSNRFYRQMVADPSTSTYIRSDISQLYTKTSLDGIDKDEAVELVVEKLNSLNISITNTPDVYTLDYDTFKNEWEDMTKKDGSPAEPWTKEDEAYLIVFKQKVESLPITDIGYSESEQSRQVMGSHIYGIVSKDGLIFLSCEGIYDILGRSGDVSMISFDAAKEAVKTKYEDIIITDPVHISLVSAELIPLCVNTDGIPYKFELVPAWTFIANQEVRYSDVKVDFTINTTFPIFIDGATGAEIRIGGGL